MAFDAYGNWISQVSPASALPLPSGGSGVLHGDDPPTDDLGHDGDFYVLNNGTAQYLKVNGTWVTVTGGAGDVQRVFRIAGNDPNSVQTATRPAICYGGDNSVWIKTGSGTNDTGWERKLE